MLWSSGLKPYEEKESYMSRMFERSVEGGPLWNTDDLRALVLNEPQHGVKM